MSLEKILKNKLYVRIGLSALMLVAAALFYFMGVRPGLDFASSRVMEYKFQDISLNEVEQTVGEIVTPVKTVKNTEGKIVFSFQNLSKENEEAIDAKISEKYQVILEVKKYDETPIVDPLIKYKLVNIFGLALIGTFLLIFIRTRGTLNLLGMIKIIVVFLLANLFEVVLFAGLAVLAGLIGIKFMNISGETFVLALLYALIIKSTVFEYVADKMKETGASMKEAWSEAISKNKRVIVDAIIVALVGLLPALIGLSFLRNYLILFMFTLPILALSTFEVASNILDVKLKK